MAKESVALADISSWSNTAKPQNGAEKPRKKRTVLGAAITDPYEFTGDCYIKEHQKRPWETDAEGRPYLGRIKSLARSFPTLQHLVDWMEVGTTPSRYRQGNKNDDRHERTGVTLVEFKEGEKPQTTQFKDSFDLSNALNRGQTTNLSSRRLYIVEDLSSHVIELLGSRFDVDPMFFREQIDDYMWHNVRHSWATMPDLMTSVKRRQWFRLRNTRFRYHPSQKSFDNACHDVSLWNVLRGLNNDENRWHYHDDKGMVVSVLRTKTVIWLGKDKFCPNATVGIILVDPTLQQGSPLWYGRPNWLPQPDSNDESLALPFERSQSLYRDIIQMTALYPWFESTGQANDISILAMLEPTIYTVCAEWHLVCKYLNTRLSQIELEYDIPRVFGPRETQINRDLLRLNIWRRLVPQFREMIEETFEIAFPAADRLAPGGAELGDIIPDFKHILHVLAEYQRRVDRLVDRGNAEMQLAAAREGLAESHNLARLTWLATIFVPLTFVTGLFSMSDDVGSLTGTFKTYFAAAIPVSFVALVIARWGSPLVHAAWTRFRLMTRHEKQE